MEWSVVPLEKFVYYNAKKNELLIFEGISSLGSLWGAFEKNTIIPFNELFCGVHQGTIVYLGEL